MLAVLCPLRQEAAALERALGSRFAERHAGLELRRGSLAGLPVAVAVSGMGGARVRTAVERLQRVLEPSHLLLAGFAGGLDPALPSGSLHRVGAVGRPGQPARAVPDFPWPSPPPPSQRLLTVPAVLDAAAKRRARADGYGLVDMEAADFFAEADAQGLCAGAVRVVLDEAGEDLPDIATDPYGNPRWRSVAGFILRRPHKLAALAGLGRRVEAASERLGGFVRQLARTLGDQRRETSGT